VGHWTGTTNVFFSSLSNIFLAFTNSLTKKTSENLVHFLTTKSFSTTGTPLNIQVWDADSGLEFANDLIANVTEYVIPCSVMDSIDEPRTAWKEGELDPIAIKSDGGCWVMFFSILFFKDFFFY
jgi:hypothetical protein